MDNCNSALVAGPALTETTPASNAVTSIYEVIEPGFHEQFEVIGAHYQMEVRRVGTPQTGGPGQVINDTINVGTLHGPIQQGTTNSTQAIRIEEKFKEEIRALLQKLQKMMKDVTSQESRRDMVCDLQTIEAQLQSSKPKRPIIKESLHSLHAIAEGVGAAAIVEIT